MRSRSLKKLAAASLNYLRLRYRQVEEMEALERASLADVEQLYRNQEAKIMSGGELRQVDELLREEVGGKSDGEDSFVSVESPKSGGGEKQSSSSHALAADVGRM